MDIEDERLKLVQRRESLHSEVLDIQNEVVVLSALIKKAEEELEEIQTKLDELDKPSKIKFAYAG